MANGCLNQIQSCISAAGDVQNGYTGKVTYNASSNPSLAAICSEAQAMCRDNVEGLYYAYGGRGTYDIRHPAVSTVSLRSLARPSRTSPDAVETRLSTSRLICS